MKDSVTIYDNINLKKSPDKTSLSVFGFFSCKLFERGKYIKGSSREGFNIATLTGCEHLAQLQSYSSYLPLTPAREDRLKYIGMGTGTQPEVPSVSFLVSPVPFDAGNNFLAQLALPSFPLTPSKTTARYSRVFLENEISINGPVTLTEAGLFTDGSPLFSYTPGTRDITIANSAVQAPNFYKVFEPLEKTDRFTLEIYWDVRFGG